MPTATPPPTQPNDALACYADNPLSMIDACMLPQLVEATGGPPIFGLMLAGFVSAAFWTVSKDIRLVAVINLVFGSVLFPLLPPEFRSMAYSIIIVALASAAFAIQRGGR